MTNNTPSSIMFAEMAEELSGAPEVSEIQVPTQNRLQDAEDIIEYFSEFIETNDTDDLEFILQEIDLYKERWQNG